MENLENITYRAKIIEIREDGFSAIYTSKNGKNVLFDSELSNFQAKYVKKYFKVGEWLNITIDDNKEILNLVKIPQ